MEKFVIQGNKKLHGSIEVFGAKNAALPILAASILSSQKSVIDNLPLIGDVFSMLDILKSIGVKIKFVGKRKIEIDPSNVDAKNINYDLVAKIRSSVFLFGALSSRVKKFQLAVPGGCKLGSRILDPHIKALDALGVKIQKVKGVFHIENSNSKEGKIEVVLSEMSVTATENAILAAVLSLGVTEIFCAASDPYVSDLCRFLKKMGADISGESTHHLKIQGVEKLNGVRHIIMPDPIEMGTFIALGAASKSNITVKNIVPEFIRFELLKFKEANVKFKILNKREFEKGCGYEACDVEIFPSRLKAVKKVHNMPYPGFASDILPIFATLMTQADGVSLIHDWMYEGRMKYIEELNRMGSDAFVCDPHRALITGPTKLIGKEITSFDLRAGATLVIAALIANGTSVINNAYQVDRGYENIEERLRKIGANIKRI